MAHIDWLTIVGRRPEEPHDWTTNSAYITASQWLLERSDTFREAFENPMEYGIVKPRAPYSYARRSFDCTRTLYVHPLSAHFTFEASGTHCGKIAPYMPGILKDFAPYLSRIDIAVDMETPVKPLEFDAACNPARINTRSRMNSSTGETVYIGSRSSERFARVYRYFAPHPRSHLLRAEFQLKGEYAKQAGQAVADGVAINGLAAELGNVFGFQHPVWKVDEAPHKLKVASHAQSGNTVHWLTTTIAPLLRRLEREGRLDVEAWMKEYVLSDDT